MPRQRDSEHHPSCTSWSKPIPCNKSWWHLRAESLLYSKYLQRKASVESDREKEVTQSGCRKSLISVLYEEKSEIKSVVEATVKEIWITDNHEELIYGLFIILVLLNNPE